MVRGRFAPSPTGYLHLGNAMTALLAWLQIRHEGGEFVLRIEDIDEARSRSVFIHQAIADLSWLGLDWDEGPDIGGPFGPYRQSKRAVWYHEQIERLERNGWLYPCFCSRAELSALAEAPHGLSSETVYPGTCRGLTAEERLERLTRKPPSLRFRLPGLPLVFDDGIQGRQYVDSGGGGDFVVKRADGVMAYQLAVVVDDAGMAITDVWRGADLLDSTPRQLGLFRALGMNPPRFAHVPVLVGRDGQRLSKRHRDMALVRLRQAGKSPEAVVGCLAYLSGLTSKMEAVAARELISEFSLKRIPPTQSVTLREEAQHWLEYGSSGR